MQYLLIASRPRSGTHYLRTLLGSCPGVFSVGREPFHTEFRGSGNPEYWDGATDPEIWLQSKCPPRTKLCVFVCQMHDYDGIMEALQRCVTHVVILYRRDMFAQFVSRELAAAEPNNEGWSTEIGTAPAHGRLMVHFEQYLQWREEMLQTRVRDVLRWKDRSWHEIAFENLIENADLVSWIGKWLDIDTSNARPNTIKKELRPLSEVVINYQEAERWSDQWIVF